MKMNDRMADSEMLGDIAADAFEQGRTSKDAEWRQKIEKVIEDLETTEVECYGGCFDEANYKIIKSEDLKKELLVKKEKT